MWKEYQETGIFLSTKYITDGNVPYPNALDTLSKCYTIMYRYFKVFVLGAFHWQCQEGC